MLLWGGSAKLDVDSLGLDGRDAEIARVIAEETEKQRILEREKMPPISPDEAASPAPATGLLGSVFGTVEEARDRGIASIAWDDLLRRGDAHTRCVTRTGLDHLALLDFALAKCAPSNWDALFWYQQWVREAISDKVPRQTVALMLSNVKAHAENQFAQAQAKQRQQSALKAAVAKVCKDPKTEKKRAVKEIWDRWQREPRLYPSQAAFARDMLDKYGGQEADDLKSQVVIQRWCKEWKDDLTDRR